MKTYDVTFQLTGDFYERVQAANAEDALKAARAYVDSRIDLRIPYTVDIVKVEEV